MSEARLQVALMLWTWMRLFSLACCGVILVSCGGDGQSGSLTPRTEPTPQVEQQAVENLVDLFRQALIEEDIDRLQELLQPANSSLPSTLVNASRQEDTAELRDVQTFRESMSRAFRDLTSLALDIPASERHIAADRRSVSFLVVESLQDPSTLAQHTRAFRLTFELTEEVANDITTLRISDVIQEAPQVEVVTPGQVLPGVQARVQVTANSPAFEVSAVDIEVPETGVRQALTPNNTGFHGSFMPPANASQSSLLVRLQERNGERLLLHHRFRTRNPGEGVVQRIDGTGLASFFAVTIGPDGTVSAGGVEAPLGGGTLYHVLPGTTTATLVGDLVSDAEGEIRDLLVDQLGRLHAIVFSPTTSGDIVMDQGQFCQTINVFADIYPFQALNLVTGEPEPSASPRATAAADGNIWLYGSDGGVAQVADSFRQANCPTPAVDVRYDPVFQRSENGLPSNTVPAFVPADDGALWFGTALGLVRFQDGQFTSVPFGRELRVPEDAATLEGFFQEVARAIFEARPLATVAIGDVALADLFERPLIKGDLIFSAIEDQRGRLWAGTLGGGLRRIERLVDATGERFGDTLHLTRAEVAEIDPLNGTRIVVSSQGIVSNIILALAVGTDGSIWAATDKGVSRIQEQGADVVITNFTAVDGLALPVRDVAVDAAGVVWLATDGGLFRLIPQGEVIQGVVANAAGQPVAGVDVALVGTPFRTVTNAEGRFILANLPSDLQRLRIDGSLAPGGPVVLPTGEMTVTPGGDVVQIHVTSPQGLRLQRVAGDRQTGVVGTALLQALTVAVVDERGNPQPGVPVTFAVTGGNGRLNAAQPVTTDAQGAAQVALTLGMLVGSNQVTATLASGGADPASLTFTATALVDRASARFVRIAGNNQSAPPGGRLQAPVVVQLEDQFRNPLPAVSITLRVQQGDTETVVSPSSLLQTNAQGRVAIAPELIPLGDSEEDVLLEVSADILPQVEPVQFLIIVGMVDIDDFPLDLAVAGDVVYVAGAFSGLLVIDASDPAEPVTVQTLPVEGTAFNVAVANEVAYVLTFTPTALVTFDISDPRHPVRLEPPVELNSADTPVKIVIQDALAYVALANTSTTSGSLHILDISTPDAPTLLSTLPLLRPPRGLAVVDGFAYYPAGVSGQRVIDVRDPNQPIEFFDGNLPNLPSFPGIVSRGDAAYVIERFGEQIQLRVLDLSTPGMPLPRGTARLRSRSLPFTAATIAVEGPFAYIASFDFGLQVFDISDPDAPRFVGGVDTTSVALSVATAVTPTRTLIYITDLAAGLNIVAGPSDVAADSDNDGVIDFFDAFPANSLETQDTDRDGVGNNADTDDDGDTFADDDETLRGSDPLNPRDIPIQPPVLDATNTVFVDAAAPNGSGNGTRDAPYRAISTALRAVSAFRDEGEPITVSIEAGTYSALQTGETFPLITANRRITLRGRLGADVTLVDAALFANVLEINAEGVTIEGLSLQSGISGISINASSRNPEVIVRDARIGGNLFFGIAVNGDVSVRLENNQVLGNGFRGVQLFNGVAATLTGNTIQGNGEDGMLVFAAAADLDNNVISGNAQEGVQIDFGSRASLRQNTIRQNQTRGVLVSRNSLLEEMHQNVIADNERSGVQIQSASAANLTDNEIIDNGRDTEQAGILMLGEGTRGILSTNLLSGNGFGIAVLSADAELIGNTIRESVQSGVLLRNNATATIAEGLITANSGDGILIEDTSSATIALTGSQLEISFNGDDGIDIEDQLSLVEINVSNILFEGNNDNDIEDAI